MTYFFWDVYNAQLFAPKGQWQGEPPYALTLTYLRDFTRTVEAIRIMREQRLACLPVVRADKKLVGIVTEHDFIIIASRLLESQLSPAE